MTSSIPWCLALGPVLFNVFVRDVNSEVGCTLSKIVDDTRLGIAVKKLEWRDAIHGDLDKQAHCMLGCTKSSVADRSRAVILSPYTLFLWKSWSSVSNSGVFNTRKTWTYLSRSRGGPWRWSTSAMKTGWSAWEDLLATFRYLNRNW